MKDKEKEKNNAKNNIIFKNEGGIDLSRVINKDYLLSLGDFYKCSICSKIMVNPTDCENCGHSFCNECISKSNCPFGCEKKSFKPASMGIRNLLNNLKFNCPNEGCKEIISYIDVKTHDNICPFQKMICPNKECNEQLLKKDLENHIKNDCKYSLIKCNYCNYKFPRCQISEHEKVCSMAYQSFSSSGNIMNVSNNNSSTNINNASNNIKKQSDNIKIDSNQYNIKSVSYLSNYTNRYNSLKEIAKPIIGTNQIQIFDQNTKKIIKKSTSLKKDEHGYSIFPDGCRHILINNILYLTPPISYIPEVLSAIFGS